MMLFITTIATAIVAANAINTESAIGQHLLSHARRLDQNAEYSDVWISGYSIKFQGCHTIKQWNINAEGEDDVKISTEALIRFRLCPTDSCSSTSAAGCKTGYGDYVIDMDNFLASYYEAYRQNIEYSCEAYAQSNCADCADDGDNRETCEYDCFITANMPQCIDRNPYEEDDGQQQQFEVQNYMACAEFKANRRNLAEDQVKYYVGPYCGSQGGSILLGLFTDDTCTTEASDVNFEELYGFKLPYSEASIVNSYCLSCLEPADANAQNENDQADADAVSESCETLYSTAGKCEQSLAAEVNAAPNNAACNYIEGIKIVRKDGIITSAASRPSAVATSFIVISAMAFFAMAFYVWYLRTRLGVKQSTLL
jgi:hypothetical protein